MQSLIGFLNSHEGLYIGLCYASLALALGLGARAWRPAWLDAMAVADAKGLDGNSFHTGGRPAVFFLLILGVAVVLFRLPVILTERVLNLDECLQIVGGWSLLHDPVPWRGVDNGTSGPLNMYALTAALAIGLPPKLITARVVMVVLGLVLVGCTYFTLLRLGGPLAAVPAATVLGLFMCFTLDPNHAHYNSEALPVALLAAALLLYVRSRSPRFEPGPPVSDPSPTGATSSSNRWFLIYASGLLLGALPYAKMQAAPLGVFWALVFALDLWRNGRGAPVKWSGLLALGAGGVTVPVLMSCVLVATGAWHDFVMSYFGFAGGYGLHSMSPLLVVFNPFTGPDMPWFLLYCAAVVLGPFVCLGKTAGPPAPGFKSTMAVLLCYLMVALLMVVAPWTGFQHYSALALHPVALLLGLCVGRLATLLAGKSLPERRVRVKVAAGLVFAATAAFFVAHVCGCFVPAQDEFRVTVERVPGTHWVSFLPVLSREPSPVDDFIASHARRGDRMSVWGWAPDYYIRSGVPNATREAITITDMAPMDVTAGIGAALQGYYRARYLGDLRRARPAFFVDAVSSSEFYCNDRRTQGHEAWPGLAAFVRENYVKVFEREVAPGDGTRVYMLKERAPVDAGRR